MNEYPNKKQLLVNPEDYKLFFREYSSLDEFLKLIITMPINHDIFNDLSSVKYVEKFNYFNTFEEAWNACYYGWNHKFEDFKEKIARVETQIISDLSKTKQLNISGYYPKVPLFLKNNPRNMINTDFQIKSTRTIVINFNAGISSFESQDAIINRGVCLISLIKHLEKKYNVVLNLLDIGFEYELPKNEMIYTIINLKKETEKINIKKLYFPLVNPDFLRRLCFRNRECTFGINKSWVYTYGYPYIPSIQENKNSILVSTPAEMNITGENLKEDYYSFMRYIERQMTNDENNILRHTKNRVE